MRSLLPVTLIVTALVGGSWFMAGCSNQSPPTRAGDASDDATPVDAAVLPELDLLGTPASGGDHPGTAPPADRVTIPLGPESLELWPYTGSSFDGSPVDPVNLVFVGKADPVTIRAALMALDGDRSAFGYPDAYPFNARWSDAIGDVQTNYADGEGWTGSVVQLQLGNYNPIRFHLRLFQTKNLYGEEGVWTVGAAHFEIMIPNTADHQVLSWEKAREIVVADMLRTGLLDATVPVIPVGPITQTPTFREIPDVIYNGIPAELKVFIGGPLGPVTEPVGITNDGAAYVLNVATAAEIIPGTANQAMDFEYDIVLPKPFCQGSPPAYVHLSGPVSFELEVSVDDRGRLAARSGYRGFLTVVPLDISVMPPQPSGIPYGAEVVGSRHGSIRGEEFRIEAQDKRIAPQPGGTEMLHSRLKVYSGAVKRYKAIVHCLDSAL